MPRPLTFFPPRDWTASRRIPLLGRRPLAPLVGVDMGPQPPDQPPPEHMCKPKKIARGGWMVKCQKLVEHVLAEDWVAAKALAESYSGKIKAAGEEE